MQPKNNLFGGAMLYLKKEFTRSFDCVKLCKSGVNLAYLAVITIHSNKDELLHALSSFVKITKFSINCFFTRKNLCGNPNKESTNGMWH